jgi:hypothetical protein
MFNLKNATSSFLREGNAVHVSMRFEIAECNGIVSLERIADAIYLSKEIGKPESEVWYHLDLLTGVSKISIVTNGEIVHPTYQTGWGAGEYWGERWRLLKSIDELASPVRWRAEIFKKLTILDKQLILRAIDYYWVKKSSARKVST